MYGITRTCLELTLMVCYVGVLQVRKRKALCGTTIAQPMEVIKVVKGPQRKYYKVGSGGPPYLRNVRSLSDTVTSVKGQVIFLGGMRCPSMES